MSIVPEFFSKTKWIHKWSIFLDPFLTRIEENYGISRVTVVGFPVMLLFIWILLPYVKRKNYDDRFIVLLICFIVYSIVVVSVQVLFSLNFFRASSMGNP